MNISGMIKVGMGDLKVCKTPGVLTTLGLGSCVGVALYDPVSKVSGLLHCMLPDSTQFKNVTNVAKYADSGLIELISQMEKLGANKTRMVAKIAGGAQMFASKSHNDTLKVGERNVMAVKMKLSEMQIRIIAEDTGLNFGRTVEFYSETGKYKIKAVGKPEKII
jgi:chemotaxis protein CheD|nr:chemotaxis protein CheD [Lachnospira multipara]